jgi:hypothetical protein
MSFTARDILWAVQTTLQDAANRRWTLEELRVYLNDGIKQIAFLKPSAVSKTKRVAMQEGTYQELPDGEHLLRVTRNITSAVDVTPRVAGPVITPIDRSILDAQFQNWHDEATVPFSATVTHVMMDEENPRAFYVYPGNDGNGAIEAVVSTVPTMVAAPTNPLSLDSYTTVVDLPTLYENPLRDYVLSRAFEKDAAIPGAMQRAAAYRQSFNNSLGVKMQVENANNINTDR